MLDPWARLSNGITFPDVCHGPVIPALKGIVLSRGVVCGYFFPADQFLAYKWGPTKLISPQTTL
jgi:hypothetical protein